MHETNAVADSILVFASLCELRFVNSLSSPDNYFSPLELCARPRRQAVLTGALAHARASDTLFSTDRWSRLRRLTLYPFRQGSSVSPRESVAPPSLAQPWL